MIITDITKEKKHLCRVCFDCGREELIDSDTLSVYCLHKDEFITEEKLSEIISESEYNRAKQRALWYLDSRAFTEKGLYNKLVEKGFKKEVSAKVIARFTEIGLLNDRAYAENFLERCICANISKRETYRKMFEKGIKKELIEELLESTEVDERAQIREILNKKYRMRLECEENIKKVYAALIRKGFSFGAVRDELKAYSEELSVTEFGSCHINAENENW